jgi:hypothetical protein
MVIPFGCHIVLLSRDLYVWMYPTSNIWKNFTIFLHIMLEYNLDKILRKKFISFYKVKDLIVFVEVKV